jgi:hypothetical protein
VRVRDILTAAALAAATFAALVIPLGGIIR